MNGLFKKFFYNCKKRNVKIGAQLTKRQIIKSIFCRKLTESKLIRMDKEVYEKTIVALRNYPEPFFKIC